LLFVAVIIVGCIISVYIVNRLLTRVISVGVFRANKLYKS